MSQVAFESNTQALKPYLAPSVRSPSWTDSGSPSSFDSLIDDSLPPAQDPRPAASNDPPRNDASQRSQAQSNDQPDRPDKPSDKSKSADATPDSAAPDDGDKSKAAKDAKDAKSGDATKDSKDTKNAKDADQAAAAPITAAAGGATSTDAAKTADTTAGATAVAGQTPVATVVTVATTSAGANAGQKSADTGAIDAAGTQKGQADLLVALQAETAVKTDGKSSLKVDTEASDKAGKKTADKTADTAKTAPQTPAALDAAAKAQNAGATEKAPDADAHAHANIVADTHRGTTPENAAKTTADDKSAAQKPTTDLAQPTVLPAPTQQPQTSAATVVPVANTQSAPKEAAVPLNGVGIEIASKALSGKNQFDIRLDPPELGRIHVRLDVDHKGNVITHMVADRTDTLDMLRRDSAGLERALQDAGLKTSDNGMQFSLRDQSANQQQNESRSANTANVIVDDTQAIASEAIVRDYSRYGVRVGGLDISV